MSGFLVLNLSFRFLKAEGDRIIPRLRLTVGGRTSPVIKDSDDGSESISSLPEEDGPTSDNQSTTVPADSPTVLGAVPILMTSDKKFSAQPNTLFALQKTRFSGPYGQG